jgi:hypothetical protein
MEHTASTQEEARSLIHLNKYTGHISSLQTSVLTGAIRTPNEYIAYIGREKIGVHTLKV